MRATSFLLPLAFAFAANALDISIGPDTVCGSNSVDCNNGFCCSSGNKCDTSGTITKCGTDGTPALPYGVGNIASAVESQAKSAAAGLKSAINDIPLSSLAGELGSFATAFPTSVAQAFSSLLSDGNIPTDAAGLSSLMEMVPSAVRPAASSAFNELNSILGAGPSGTGSAGQPENTGSAAMLGASSFGNTAVLVGMIWGAAAIGGAMLVL
ncbi:hypothetical protein P171DRAFT_490950 [Karstenula rhodostoma CBS 690.94]|uniref:Extracellular membrane protein CFEM domain-containing protein n=1 Tax=Karstenula rhodostoma CBS 690.94 TaxID=1392251 RepID=A0A9P4P7N8_9PLEO|nr:hypothetical protein P171DRAFT_490950 [Karstenula rhodostoma CBS 690.94]